MRRRLIRLVVLGRAGSSQGSRDGCRPARNSRRADLLRERYAEPEASPHAADGGDNKFQVDNRLPATVRSREAKTNPTSGAPTYPPCRPSR
jgi:hypothetical protein